MEKARAKNGTEIKLKYPRGDMMRWKLVLCDNCVHGDLYDDEKNQVCPVSLFFVEDTVLLDYEDMVKGLHQLYNVDKATRETFKEVFRGMVLGRLGDHFLTKDFICKLFYRKTGK